MRKSTARIALGIILAAWCCNAGASGGLDAGQRAPDFTLTALDGSIVRLSRSLGEKATVVVFWAAWSPRSGDALETLRELCQEYCNKGDLQVIAVNVEHETWEPGEYEKIAGYILAKKLPFPVVFDMDLTLYEAYGVTVVPSLILAGPDGAVAATLGGYPDSMRKYFYRDLGAALGADLQLPDES